MTDAEVLIRYKNPRCNALVPSDDCANGAHGTFIPDSWVPGIGQFLDALVMWSPEWHVHLQNRGMNNFGRITEDLEYRVIDACVYDMQHKIAFPVYRDFRKCIQYHFSYHITGMKNPQVQVGIVGLDLSAYSAARGGLIVRTTPYGTVVMLPTLANLVW